MASLRQSALVSTLGAALVLAAAPALAAKLCPADRLVFHDQERNLTFGAERVAVDHKYLCGGRLVAKPPRDAALGDCKGPLGKTIIEGYLDGRKVYAVYSQIAAVPCCSWDSFSAVSPLAKQPQKWVSGRAVPRVALGSEWWTIEDNPPNRLTGPLGGGKFVPESCRD